MSSTGSSPPAPYSPAVSRRRARKALLACVNVIILTATATLGSFLYNLATAALGGLEVTFAED